LDNLKAELEAAKLHVRETEEDKVNYTQEFEVLKFKLASMKTTFRSAEREVIKVCCLLILFNLFFNRDIADTITLGEHLQFKFIVCHIELEL
jgi:hypothetical protein